MTLEEFKQVLTDPDNFPKMPIDVLIAFFEKFYKSNAKIEEWEFYPEGAQVIALYEIQSISPNFFRKLLAKRNKALGSLPKVHWAEYIKAAIEKYKGDRK